MKRAFGRSSFLAFVALTAILSSGQAPSGSPYPSPPSSTQSPIASVGVERTRGVALGVALKSLNAELSWDSIGGRGLLQRGGRSVSFIAGGSTAFFSSGEKENLPVPFFFEGDLIFPLEFMAVARSFFEAPEPEGKFTVAAIIIDPGHGGRDPGAGGEHGKGRNAFKLNEKDITLDAAKQVYERLSVAFPSKKIIITRPRDIYLSLEERTDIANAVPLKKNEAIILVSVHVNSAISKNARGFEVWYLDPSIRRNLLTEQQRKTMSPDLIPIFNNMLEEEITTESILLADSLLKSLDEVLGPLTPKRGIKAESWYVVRNALMPSALIELPFISNEKDARLLSDPEDLRKMSMAIYNGIVSFVGYFENSKGFTE